MRHHLIILVLLLAACSTENTVSFGIAPSEVADLAQHEFDRNGMWYKQLPDGRFEFKESDVQTVRMLVGNIYESIIPSGNSSSYGPEMEKIIIKKLEASSLQVDVRRFDGENWYIWSDPQSNEYKALVREAEEELMSALNKQVAQ
jgi:hypothetical protein